MKRCLFGFLLLALLALPTFALGLSWADYTAQVDAALVGQSGEVVLKIPPDIEPYLVDEATGLPQDAILMVPEGISLVLSDGQLPGLLLGGGDITLRNAEITGMADTPSVYIMQERRAKQPLRLSLTIEEDTTVASASGSALGVMPEPLMAWTLSIENRGAVQAPSGASAMTLVFGGRQTVSFSLKNTGTISGGQGIRMDLRPSGKYWCALYNEGEVAGETTGLTLSLSGRLQGDYLSVVNQAEGVIRCGETGDAAIGIRADSKQGKVQVINHGLLEGQSAAITLACSRDKLLPVEVINDGTLACAEGAAPLSLAIAQRVEKPRGILDADGIRRELKTFLDDSAFYSLPKGTQLRAYVDATVKGGETIPAAAEATFESIQLVRPALPWRDFYRQISGTLSLAHGDVLYHPTQRVLAFQTGDKPLVVPEGAHLRIIGGTFETMLLGSGAITLEGTLVEVIEDGYTSIQIERKDEPTHLTLVLDEGTHIANYGMDGIGLGTGTSFHKEISIDVTNHGLIECMMGQAVSLHPAADSKHPVSLRFQNDGDILGDTLGLSLGAGTHQGVGSVSCLNTGTVETREGAGLSIAMYSYDGQILASLENAETGSIRSQSGYGLQFDLREATGTSASHGSEGWIHNDGQIEGGPAALSLWTPPQHPVQMSLRVGGSLICSNADAPEVLVQFDQRLDRKNTTVLDEATFANNRETFIDLLGLRYLPEETRVSSHMLVQNGASTGEPLYTQTAQGGGETSPDATEK